MVILTQVGETHDKLSTFFDLSDSKFEGVYINKPRVDCTVSTLMIIMIIIFFFRLYYVRVCFPVYYVVGMCMFMLVFLSIIYGPKDLVLDFGCEFRAAKTIDVPAHCTQ